MLTLSDSQINFDTNELGLYSQTITPITTSFPVHFIYFPRQSGTQITGHRTAFIVGFRNTFDFGLKGEEQLLALKRHSFGLDIGFGLEFQFSKFKFKPDLIYSHGLNNVNSNGTTIYNQSIASLRQSSLSLRFLFYN